jgi:hypothetical protein
MHFNTERRGGVINTPPSYSGGPGLKHGPGDRLSWLMYLPFASVPPRKCQDSTTT